MSPCEGEGSRCKSSREHQFHSSVAERAMHFFRKEDDAGATPAGGSNLLPYAVPGDDVASSIQACEACRVGASPTHLTSFVPDGASEPLGLQNRCDGSVTRGHVQFHSIQAKLLRTAVDSFWEFTAVRSTKSSRWLACPAAYARLCSLSVTISLKSAASRISKGPAFTPGWFIWLARHALRQGS